MNMEGNNSMNIWVAYLFLLAAVIFGTASNSYANSASGYTKLMPSIISIIAIVLCMYSLSNVMKVLPVGITYASFAGVCIIATSLVGIIKFNQIPNIFTLVGLLFIIIGVLIVNLLWSKLIKRLRLFLKTDLCIIR